MDPVTRVRDHFAESIATKQIAAEQLADSIVAAGRLMSDDLEPKEEIREGAPDWMVTFGDLMALLLCFFVLLLSFSETDRAKYKEVAGSLEKAFGIQRKTPAWDSPKGQSLIARDFDKELLGRSS